MYLAGGDTNPEDLALRQYGKLSWGIILSTFNAFNGLLRMRSSAGTFFVITQSTNASVDTVKLTINIRYWATYYSTSVTAATSALITVPSLRKESVIALLPSRQVGGILY